MAARLQRFGEEGLRVAQTKRVGMIIFKTSLATPKDTEEAWEGKLLVLHELSSLGSLSLFHSIATWGMATHHSEILLVDALVQSSPNPPPLFPFFLYPQPFLNVSWTITNSDGMR